ncbi:probable acetyl-CoA acetyltransferase, cytosolic 2 isoform X1 [Eutrema salsugineum]|uniref:probable acetyl-CoA acetyltransferase, cytosolic 2 isoform X1 n=2 Tax=Eutrema salsugineum TaxID=72664 RepID=UPI000CECFA16|nr:probable acetyl-CoA acetyltransferase, cytosolic 2 isoform X1 [Eutrema salsugineum]XP_024010970.1 probable acetyl-CoA acetyltransferase, cytosolic 2 isoform X1 [Eutrema salsugineum]
MAPSVSDGSIQPRDVCVVGVARTPMGGFLGSLSSMTATRLGSIAIEAALRRAKVDPRLVEEVFFGNVLTANLGQAPARQAALGAGIPYSVICTTVNKVCAAGMKSAMLAAQSIQLGLNDVVVAGGMESMSNVPKYLPDARCFLSFLTSKLYKETQERKFGFWFLISLSFLVYFVSRRGSRLGHDTVVDGMTKDGLWDVYNDFGMGVCGEICADQYRITREEQDAYAIQSFERGIAAQNARLFAWEIVPVEVSTGRGRPSVVIDKDEGLGKFDAAKLKKLRPSFKEDGGSLTAGNASSISDGAAALVLVSGEKALELGLHVIAKIRGYADAAQAPELFTTTPALAIPKAIKRAGLDASQVDYYEINEAFSVVALANQKLLGLDPERLNAHGGAVSLGHPLGCSGARILVTLLGVLRAKKGKYGVASICNGGGGASALVLEFMSEKTIGYSAL